MKQPVAEIQAGSVMSLVIRLLAVFLVVSITLAAPFSTQRLYSFHPTFMALGFLGLMTEAVLTSVQFRPLEGAARTSAIQRHMLVQIAAIVCVLVGAAAIVSNKIKHNKNHLHGLHSQLGFATVLLSLSAASGGAVSFRKLGLLTRFPERWHSPLKAVHRYLGMITWLLGLWSAWLMVEHHTIYKGPVLSWFWSVVMILLGFLMLVLAVVIPSLPSGKYNTLEADVQLAQSKPLQQPQQMQV